MQLALQGSQPEHGSEPAVPVRPPVVAAAAGASCRPAAEQPAGCANQQQLSLPEEQPQVASRLLLLCSRVRTVKEAYEVRRAAPLAGPVGSWQRADSCHMYRM